MSAFLLAGGLYCFAPTNTMAQGFDSFSEDEFGTEEGFGDEFEDAELDTLEFEESGGDFSTSEGALENIEEDFAGDQQPTEDEQYVDEDVISDDTQQLLENALTARRDFLAEERANFNLNIAYGVGTGLMIGGWFALLTASTSRDTLRSIGLGIVLGGVMGGIIGGRSVITPNLPRPAASLSEESAQNYKLASHVDPSRFTLSYQWSF